MADQTRRLLPVKDAALYCGVPRSYFPKLCPAQPVKLHARVKPKYDILDLDKWIDSMKSNATEEGSDDEIADKL